MRALPLSALALIASSLAAAEPVTNSLGMKLMPIVPGSFTLEQDGPPADYHVKKHPEKFDDADWDERPAHRVTITQPFHLGVTEVTVGQYRQFASDHRGENDGDAVTGVSWTQRSRRPCQAASRHAQ